MELLLWMWFYDPRWFFNLKVSVRCYILVWLIPVIINLSLAGLSLFFFKDSFSDTCEPSLQLWLFSRIFFTLFLSFNILFLMFKIKQNHIRENKYFDNAIKVCPSIKQSVRSYDYWIKRNSLVSTSGIFILFLGVINLYWSYVVIYMYYFKKHFVGCDGQLLVLINLNSILVFIGDLPLLLVIILLLFVKIITFASAHLCPGLIISYAKRFGKSQSIKLE